MVNSTGVAGQLCTLGSSRTQGSSWATGSSSGSTRWGRPAGAAVTILVLPLKLVLGLVPRFPLPVLLLSNSQVSLDIDSLKTSLWETVY